MTREPAIPIALQFEVQEHRKINGEKQDSDVWRVHWSCQRDFRPQVHGRRAQVAVMTGRNVVARDVEQAGDRIMDGDKAPQTAA